jgi:hypothetical protein
MNWNQAQAKIKANIKVGTDINTPSSTYRFVRAVDSIINSSRYGYQNEYGFAIPIGQSNVINIPWSMLKECFEALNSPDGYDGAFFRERFPLQAKDHPCYVHVVSQIFVKAGIAQAEGKRYRIRKAQMR